MIELKQIGCTFKQGTFFAKHTVAVSEVDMVFEKGRRYAIVGESGSGKTTLARIIAGLQRPTSGALLVEGKLMYQNPKKMKGHFKTVQLISQDSLSALDPKMSIGQSIEEPLSCFFHLNKQQRNQECEMLMQKCHLPLGYYKKLPHELSGGEQKRVAIARALAAKPSYLIFDEATNGFDLPLRKKIIDEIVQLQTTIGFTSIFITHDMELAMIVADEILVMKDSCLIEKVGYKAKQWHFTQDYSKRLLAASGYNG